MIQFDIPLTPGSSRGPALRRYSKDGVHGMQRLDTPLQTFNRSLKLKSRKTRRAFANDFSVLNPIIWANEAILQLLPNMVMANLVARDFDSSVARFGDIVNAYVPGTFSMTKKGANCDNVVIQDASGSALQVALNQWPQVSFLICDGEENRDQLDLVNTLLTPAVIAMAQGIDRILASQVYHFIDNPSGHLNLGDSTNIRNYILEARERLNRNNVPLAGRTLILTPGTETAALEVDTLVLAQDIGDNGAALREAALGRKYGFDIFMTQTEPEVTPGQAAIANVLVNGVTAAGATTLPLDGAGTGTGNNALAVGMWLVIAGDDVPHQITAVQSTTVTLNTPLVRSVADNAVITILLGGLVNNAAGYAGTTLSPRVIGWSKEILTDTWTAGSPPQIGQMVTFGTDVTNRYTITGLRTISSTAYGITLDSPLVNAIADNAVINIGPSGKYNFAFLRNAFTLVNRPLPQPRVGTLSRVIPDPVNKISIRVTISYDPVKQGHLVTLDTLMGVGVLNKNMGVAMFA